MHCEAGAFPGIDADGGLADLIRTSARSVVTLAPGIEPAVPLLYPGSTCVVMGAGGLGHIGIQCLRAMSATRIVVLDPNQDALALTGDWGADETVLVDGMRVERVVELTDGKGAEVVVDFVGERGAERDSWAMTHRAGSDFVIGDGGTVGIATIDVISTERNVVGDLVGSYNDLVELMALNAAGRIHHAHPDLPAGRGQRRDGRPRRRPTPRPRHPGPHRGQVVALRLLIGCRHCRDGGAGPALAGHLQLAHLKRRRQGVAGF